MSEALKWLSRALALLPVIGRLWDAVASDDGQAELEAKLDLVKEMKRQQALERFR